MSIEELLYRLEAFAEPPEDQRKRRKEVILSMRRQGFPYQTIGKRVGFSFQYCWYVVQHAHA